MMKFLSISNMPNSWGYPEQQKIYTWIPENHNKQLTQKVANEIKDTIVQYQQGNFQLI
jgi:hypothetical protein